MEPTLMTDAGGNSFWVTRTSFEPEVNDDPLSDPLALDIKPKCEQLSFIKQEQEEDQLMIEPPRDPLDITYEREIKRESSVGESLEHKLFFSRNLPPFAVDDLNRVEGNPQCCVTTAQASLTTNHSIHTDSNVCETLNIKRDVHSLIEVPRQSLDLHLNSGYDSPSPDCAYDIRSECSNDDAVSHLDQVTSVTALSANYNLKACFVSISRFLPSNNLADEVVTNQPQLHSSVDSLCCNADAFSGSDQPTFETTLSSKFKLKNCSVSLSRHLPSNHNVVEFLPDRIQVHSSVISSEAGSRRLKHTKTYSENRNQIPAKTYVNSRRKFKCDICSKFYNTQELLRFHKRIHSRTPLTCSNARCNKVFGTKEDLELHTNLSHKKYKCDKCSKSYYSASALKDHHDSVHLKQHEICPICKKVSKSKGSLSMHILLHARDDTLTFSCSICSKSFGSKPVLRIHLKTHSKEYSCSICHKEFALKHLLENHRIVQHKGERCYKCDECGKSFASKVYLNEHKESHRPPRFKCSHCDKLYQTKKNLNLHLKLIQNIRLPCTLCSKTFTQRRYLQRHIKTHSMPPPEPVKIHCEMCGYICHDVNSLRTHNVLSHGNKKNHKCGTCPRQFVTAIELARHEKRHTDLPFRCNLCRNRYHTSIGLEKHMKRKHSILEHRCDICSKSFTCESYLKMHKKRHSKPINCDQCNKTFSNREILKFHEDKIHASREYVCDICSKTFCAIKYLRLHQNVHNKPFKCDNCDLAFGHKRNLAKHNKIHMAENIRCYKCCELFDTKEELNIHNSQDTICHRFFCDYCGKSYQFRSSMLMHIRQMHLPA